VSRLAAEMRELEERLMAVSRERRAECIRLARGDENTQRVTYRRLAKAMNITEVAIYKILRSTGPKLRDRGADW
jgi:hypothetical protein